MTRTTRSAQKQFLVNSVFDPFNPGAILGA